MELVSNGTHSSLDGPFHGSFRKFLVNGKRPWTLVIADNRHLIIAQPRDSRRKPTSLIMRARLSHLRAVLRLSFLFGRRSNRVIEFACLPQSCNRHAIRASVKKPSIQAKRRKCLPRGVSQHSIYLHYIRPTDNARQTNRQ